MANVTRSLAVFCTGERSLQRSRGRGGKAAVLLGRVSDLKSRKAERQPECYHGAVSLPASAVLK